MGFFKHATAKPTVQVLESCIPVIAMSKTALNKMQIFIDNCAEEVGWLGTAHKEEGIIIIDDMYLFHQEVHATTTEITPEGLATFGEEILQQENGMEIWNNLKVWGHSHVRMGVSPSGQDNSQMATFANSGHDWFIRIIGNKNGDMKLDFYDYEAGIIYNDIPWVELSTPEELTVKKRIEELQKLLQTMEKSSTEALEKNIKEEITAKVKKKQWGYTHQTTGKTGYWAGNGQYKNESQTKTTTTNTTTMGGTKKKEEKEEEPRVIDGTNKSGFVYAMQDVLTKEDDIYNFFTYKDLLDIAECTTQKELVDELGRYGYDGFFSYDDTRMIKAEAREVAFGTYSKM